MKDIGKLVAVEEEQKWDMGKEYDELRSLMELNECDSMLFFRSTKRSDDLWMGLRDGMSVLFRLHNISTMKDCNFGVNAFKECGYVVMFSKEFDEVEHLQHVKGVIEQIFVSGETKDKALCFFHVDGVVWVRCYRIGEKLEELGPRFVLEVLGVFEKCFRGRVLYRAGRGDCEAESGSD